MSTTLLGRVVTLIDTSVLLVLLKVHDEDLRPDIVDELVRRTDANEELVLPHAALLEAGAHIGRLSDGRVRRERAEALQRLVTKTVDQVAPWRFIPRSLDEDALKALFGERPDSRDFVDATSAGDLEMGDLSILHELETLMGNLQHRSFSLWTLDTRLASESQLLTGRTQ